MKLKTLSDIRLTGKKVLLRTDINSAFNNGKIIDSPRMIQAAVTVRELSRKGAKTAIIAHQGRKGEPDFFPLKQHAKLLSKHSGCPVRYVDGFFETGAKKEIYSLNPGEAILLRNVRDYADESNVKSKSNKFAAFSKEFDCFVNDAFSVCHREAGSIMIPPKYLPSAIGRGMQRELEALEKISLGSGNCLFFIGGMKIEDYLPLFSVLKNKSNKIAASGVLANLFLLSLGAKLKREEDWCRERKLLRFVPELKELLSLYPKQIILPSDGATGETKRIEHPLNEFPENEKIWDIGEGTISMYKEEIEKSKTVFVKGPLGRTENSLFAKGTVEILGEISERTKKKMLFSVLGGGNLTTAIKEYRIPDNFSYLSLSGGALIAYISGKKLPGLEAIYHSPRRF